MSSSISWHDSPQTSGSKKQPLARAQADGTPDARGRMNMMADGLITPSPKGCGLFKRNFVEESSDDPEECSVLPPSSTQQPQQYRTTPVRRFGLSRSRPLTKVGGIDSGRQAAELLKSIPDTITDIPEEEIEQFCDGNQSLGPLKIRRSSDVMSDNGSKVPRDSKHVPVKITSTPMRTEQRKRPFGFSSPLVLGPPRSTSTPKHNHAVLTVHSLAKRPRFEDSLDDAETDLLLSQVCASSSKAATLNTRPSTEMKPLSPPEPQKPPVNCKDTPKTASTARARPIVAKTRSLVVLPSQEPKVASSSRESVASKDALSSAGQSPPAVSSGKSASFDLPRDDSFYDDTGFDSPDLLVSLAGSGK